MTTAGAGRDGEPLTDEMMHRLSGDLDYKRIAADWVEVPDCAQPVWVSTVWTGHDGGTDEYGRTLIFETLIWLWPYPHDAGVRAATKREAYENHQLVIRHLASAPWGSARLWHYCGVQFWVDGPVESACRLARHMGLDPDRVPEDAIIDDNGYTTFPPTFPRPTTEFEREGAKQWVPWDPSVSLPLRRSLRERAGGLKAERARHRPRGGGTDD